MQTGKKDCFIHPLHFRTFANGFIFCCISNNYVSVLQKRIFEFINNKCIGNKRNFFFSHIYTFAKFYKNISIMNVFR